MISRDTQTGARNTGMPVHRRESDKERSMCGGSDNYRKHKAPEYGFVRHHKQTCHEIKSPFTRDIY